MKKTKRRLGIYLLLLILITAAAVVLRTLACFNDFNPTTGYFDDKLIITVADWLTVGGVVLFLSYPIASGRVALRASFSSPMFYLPSGLVSVALLFLSAELLSKVWGLLSESSRLQDSLLTAELLIPLAVALLALCSIVYFLLGALIEGRCDTRRAAFGILAVLFLAVYAAYLYFDTKLPINAPTKVVDMMAYIFASAFFLFEVRISLGRDRWGAYLAFGMAAALLSGYSALPSLIVYLARGTLITNSLAEAALTMTLFIFITARVLHATRLRDDEKNPAAAAAELLSAARLADMSAEVAEELDDDDESCDKEPDNYTMNFEDTESKD